MRAVCDTNTVVSALLFSRGRLAWLRQAWRARQLTPLVCHDTVTELLRVLAYPKFQLAPEEREQLLADYLPYAETVALKPVADLPVCRDAHDQVFLELAYCGGADLLITGDRDLLALAPVFSIPIETPAAARERVSADQ